MIHINILEQREYFKGFECERLTLKEEHKAKILEFVATEDGKKLEEYLKNKAWTDDIEGETSVFVIKDSEGNIALFFSVKCGLLFKHYMYEELEETERDFVNMIIEAKKKEDNETLAGYYEYGSTEFENIDKLFKIADKRIDIKNEGISLQDSKNTLKVSECYSAIEIQHFCKNSKYQVKEGIEVALGFGLFWEKIVPHIIKITKEIGCKYLYLFAANNLEDDSKKLVRYYKSAFKFSEVEDVNIIKPEYDENCYGLIQEIKDLTMNQNAVWEQFSDMA